MDTQKMIAVFQAAAKSAVKRHGGDWEDIAQELWTKLNTFDASRATLATWAGVAAARIAIDNHRRKDVRERHAPTVHQMTQNRNTGEAPPENNSDRLIWEPKSGQWRVLTARGIRWACRDLAPFMELLRMVRARQCALKRLWREMLDTGEWATIGFDDPPHYQTVRRRVNDLRRRGGTGY